MTKKAVKCVKIKVKIYTGKKAKTYNSKPTRNELQNSAAKNKGKHKFQSLLCTKTKKKAKKLLRKENV